MRIGGHIATVAVLFAVFLVFPAWQGGVSVSAIMAQHAFSAESAPTPGQDSATAGQDSATAGQGSPVPAQDSATAGQDSADASQNATTTYTILVNRDLHADADELARLVAFLAGKNATPPHGNVSCTICTFDHAGAALAKDFAARLSANQMTLHDDVGVLVLSKVEAGKFDIVVMSDEVAEAVGAYTAYDLPFVEVIHR